MSYCDYTLRLILIGDSSSGKEEFCRKFSTSLFEENLKLTLGIDFYAKTISFEGKTIKLQLWVFGGEERFRFLHSQYCRRQNGAIIMYDITNSKTLDFLIDYIHIIRENAGDIPIMLVGNMLDL